MGIDGLPTPPIRTETAVRRRIAARTRSTRPDRATPRRRQPTADGGLARPHQTHEHHAAHRPRRRQAGGGDGIGRRCGLRRHGRATGSVFRAGRPRAAGRAWRAKGRREGGDVWARRSPSGGRGLGAPGAPRQARFCRSGLSGRCAAAPVQAGSRDVEATRPARSGVANGRSAGTCSPAPAGRLRARRRPCPFAAGARAGRPRASRNPLPPRRKPRTGREDTPRSAGRRGRRRLVASPAALRGWVGESKVRPKPRRAGRPRRLRGSARAASGGPKPTETGAQTPAP